MKTISNKSFLFFLILFVSYSALYSQENIDYYKIYDDFIGVENLEINNGNSYHTKYRTIDKTHVFLGNYSFYQGKIVYRKQVYKTLLQYDIFNDLIVIKHIDKKNAFSLSLIPELISQFSFNNQFFVKLPPNKDLASIYQNGLFERVFVGKTLSLYIKHIKTKIERLEENIIQFSFEEKKVYLLKYKNNYHVIHKKRDIIKVLPFFKDEIKSFYSDKRKINKESLLQLVKELDKITTNEEN